jgi:uncharacterized repeat protein (TIGR01451 family)
MTVTAALLAAAPAYGAFPGQNGKIAFSSNRDGDYDIYSMNPDGSGVTQLTNDPAADRRPAWSSDGLRIAFMRGEEIWTMGADGTEQTRLLSFRFIQDPTWSPDGTKISFAVDDHCGSALVGLNVMNADGSDPRNIICVNRLTSSPSWSPDGQRIAFSSGLSDPEIWSVRPDGTGLLNLSNTNSTFGDTNADWAPDGQRIIFNRSFFEPDDGIFTMNADGSGQTKIAGTNLADFDPAWSPDGTKIVFGRQVSGDKDIYTANADGTGQANITNSATTQDEDPAWQPIVVQPAADVSVTKTDSPDPVIAGELLTYTVRVDNAGPLTARSVELVDEFSRRVRVRSVRTTQGGCNLKHRTLRCALGDLSGGESATVTIVVRPRRQGSLTNSASASAIEPPDPNAANNTATAVTTVQR